ncbi:GNAT family N-acetyltransferase [Chloroflexota bacterium]
MVRLVPMTESEFEIYLQHAIEDYAQDHIQAGNWDSSDALQKAEKEFLDLLPNGVTSKEQHLFSIEEGPTGVKIGLIWFADKSQESHPIAFIYDFLIYEEYRNKGYGKQTLLALEEEVKKLGIETISLHVFGHNKNAIHLYQTAGYEITNLHMSKKLSQ